MKLDALRPILHHPGPFTMVSLDTTRSADAADKDVKGRWSALRRALKDAGAPPETLELLADVVLARTRTHGPHGRFAVVADGEVLVDVVTPEPPVRDEAHHGGIPVLLPAVRAVDQEVHHLLVEVDRAGADLHWSWPEPERKGTPQSAEGGHDVLHKVPAGGLSHRRMQSRVEDSWERNAEAVAAEVDRLVAEHRPELVLLTGDVRAVPLVRGALGKQAAEIEAEVPGGSRAEGVHEDAFATRLEHVLDAHRARRREAVVDRLREGLGRGDGAVTGLADVVDVLRKGQLEELVVLMADAGSVARLYERALWVGPDPLHIATEPATLHDLGVDDGAVQKVRADVAVLRAALAQDAGVTLTPEGSVDLAEGLGGTLRWSDAATPHDLAPSYAADTGRLGAHR